MVVVHETTWVRVADNEIPDVRHWKTILVTLEEFANFWRLSERTDCLCTVGDASCCCTHLKIIFVRIGPGIRKPENELRDARVEVRKQSDGPSMEIFIYEIFLYFFLGLTVRSASVLIHS